VTETDLEHLKRSIVSVGLNKGRGFVVKNDYGDPCIITAAHCLPEMPDCCCCEEPPGYHDLIGPLGEKPSVLAQVEFADPISDIAVLTGWDGDYEALTEHPLPISLPSDQEGPAFVLSLDGRWIDLKVKWRKWLSYGHLWVVAAGEKFAGGMSGSPIVTHDGAAIGVVSGSTRQLTSFASGGAGEVWAPVDSPQPCIAYCLPPRLGISTKEDQPAK
jgi:Trypsin-like peptidase domain